MYDNIKRIFFDSGMVLNHPKSGHWFFTNTYIDLCKANKINSRSIIQRFSFSLAKKYLFRQVTVKDIETEYSVFLNFYKMLFRFTKIRNNDSIIRACAYSKVFDTGNYVFYDDVLPSVQRLSRKYEIGIISNAWPSLVNVYSQTNLLGYFKPFIISSVYGCTKDSNALFEIAFSQIREKPEECVFIDDYLPNCERAAALGMKPIHMDRAKPQGNTGTGSVGDLKDLENILRVCRSVQ
jgi:putative hydrolase of the HAD superfamily